MPSRKASGVIWREVFASSTKCASTYKEELRTELRRPDNGMQERVGPKGGECEGEGQGQGQRKRVNVLKSESKETLGAISNILTSNSIAPTEAKSEFRRGRE